jgi:hypothetical protein
MIVRNITDKNDRIIAHVYDTNEVTQTFFATPDNFPLQFSVGVNPAGKEFPAHVHLPIERSIVGTGEFVFVTAGKMIAVFLDDDGNFLDQAHLTQGMGFLQIQGGHALRTVDATRFIEVKQGPYNGKTADKKMVEVTGD